MFQLQEKKLTAGYQRMDNHGFSHGQRYSALCLLLSSLNPPLPSQDQYFSDNNSQTLTLMSGGGQIIP